jgi:hypothetical protein|tara:strand:+ start:344 stop:589 length:246 start_codon:yes stop_codon:yes gene_type:complete
MGLTERKNDMSERKERINKVFVKLFEQIAEAQQIINKDYAPEDLEKVEFKSTYKKPSPERSVKLKLDDTLRDVLGGVDEEE